MNNRVTLNNLPAMPVGEVAALPPDQLKLLMEDAEAALQAARTAKAWLEGALGLKYGDRAHQLRAAEDKDAGRVRFEDGDFVVVADLPKRVSWDQDELAAIAARIREAGDDPSEFVRTTLEVSERAYAAWPSAIRRLFEPARTVRYGKPRYVIEARCEEAA